MLCLGQSLARKQVLSLRTGAPIAELAEPIINPNNLKIEAWYVMDRFDKKQMIVLSQEVRDVVGAGLIVNDHEALSDPSELVRLQKILDLHFKLLGKPVITDHKKHLGKVSDFAFEKDSAYIEKLYIAQSMLKNFSGSALTIDRSQIVEITDRKIVVREPTVTETAPATAPLPAN